VALVYEPAQLAGALSRMASVLGSLAGAGEKISSRGR
jgi:hypothetical protein